MEQQLPARRASDPERYHYICIDNPSLSRLVSHHFTFSKARDLRDFELFYQFKPGVLIVSLWVADKHGEYLNVR
jgi:hypothetical protein